VGRKNLRKIPDTIRQQIDVLGADLLVAAVVVKVAHSSIAAGDMAHIQIRFEDGKVACDREVMPLPSRGRYSKVNVDGKVVKLKNLPKVEKTWYVETPNWGDWSKGSHDVPVTRMVYQRRYIPPRELALLVELLGEEAGAGEATYLFKVSVEEVLDRAAADFEDRLLFDLNLLQENVGNHGVYASTATMADYLRTMYVDWEILPPGEHDANIAKILAGFKGPAQARDKVIERYTFMMSLKPQLTVVGTNSFRRYFGALFADDLVAFENTQYGNAIYVMGGNWQSLSKLSRLELLSHAHAQQQYLARIIHTEGWQDKLRAVLRRELNERGIPR